MLGGRRGHETPDNLDRLLRDCAPGCRPDDDHRRRLRMQLDHNLRHHSAVSRIAPVAVLLAVAVLGALQLTDVGSGGFQLEKTQDMVGDNPILEAPLGNFRIASTEQGRTVSPGQQAYLENLYESMEARQGRLVGGTGWTVAGSTIFILDYEHIVDGKRQILPESPEAPGREAGLRIFQFLQGNKEDFLGKVAAGLIPGAGQAEKELSGHTILFAKWTAHYAGWGDITYWEYVSHR